MSIPPWLGKSASRLPRQSAVKKKRSFARIDALKLSFSRVWVNANRKLYQLLQPNDEFKTCKASAGGVDKMSFKFLRETKEPEDVYGRNCSRK
jgi:hypothetical protein